jgi:hypothetical protein
MLEICMSRLEASLCGHRHPLSGSWKESRKVLERIDEYTTKRCWLDEIHQQRNGAVLMWAGVYLVLSQSSPGRERKEYAGKPGREDGVPLISSRPAVTALSHPEP